MVRNKKKKIYTLSKFWAERIEKGDSKVEDALI
jgi:hypothetical protein